MTRLRVLLHACGIAAALAGTPALAAPRAEPPQLLRGEIADGDAFVLLASPRHTREELQVLAEDVLAPALYAGGMIHQLWVMHAPPVQRWFVLASERSALDCASIGRTLAQTLATHVERMQGPRAPEGWWMAHLDDATLLRLQQPDIAKARGAWPGTYDSLWNHYTQAPPAWTTWQQVDLRVIGHPETSRDTLLSDWSDRLQAIAARLPADVRIQFGPMTNRVDAAGAYVGFATDGVCRPD